MDPERTIYGTKFGMPIGVSEEKEQKSKGSWNPVSQLAWNAPSSYLTSGLGLFSTPFRSNHIGSAAVNPFYTEIPPSNYTQRFHTTGRPNVPDDWVDELPFDDYCYCTGEEHPWTLNCKDFLPNPKPAFSSCTCDGELHDPSNKACGTSATEPRPVPKQPEPPIAPSAEFSWNPLTPFKLVVRGILLPIIGQIDITIGKSVAVVFSLVSLVYHSLPLTNFARVQRYVNLKRKPVSGTLVRFIGLFRCDDCHRCRKVRPVTGVGDDWMVSALCAHSLHITLSRLVNVAVTVKQLQKLGSIIPKSIIDLPVGEKRRKWWNDRVPQMKFTQCPHLGDYKNDPKPTFTFPSETPDGLLYAEPDQTWRRDQRCNGGRCVDCYRTCFHSIATPVRGFMPVNAGKRAKTGKWGSDPNSSLACLAREFIRIKIFQEEHFVDGEDYFVISATLDRADQWTHPGIDKKVFALVDSQETGNVLLSRHPKGMKPLQFLVLEQSVYLRRSITTLSFWLIIMLLVMITLLILLLSLLK
jgi:hypothetical protein